MGYYLYFGVEPTEHAREFLLDLLFLFLGDQLPSDYDVLMGFLAVEQDNPSAGVQHSADHVFEVVLALFDFGDGGEDFDGEAVDGLVVDVGVGVVEFGAA